MVANISVPIHDQEGTGEDAPWAGQIRALATPRERLRTWVAHTTRVTAD